MSDSSKDSDSSGLSGDESAQSDSEAQKAAMKKKALITDAIDKNISRFFFNLDTKDVDRELQEDFEQEELEDFSDDEIKEDTENILKEDNKKISYAHARNINDQMIKMTEAFCRMSSTMEKNLTKVQQYIKHLQASSKEAQAGDEIGAPKLDRLSKIID